MKENNNSLEDKIKKMKEKEKEINDNMEKMKEKCFELETLNNALKTELNSTAISADQMTKKASEKDNKSKALNA